MIHVVDIGNYQSLPAENNVQLPSTHHFPGPIFASKRPPLQGAAFQVYPFSTLIFRIPLNLISQLKTEVHSSFSGCGVCACACLAVGDHRNHPQNNENNETTRVVQLQCLIIFYRHRNHKFPRRLWYRSLVGNAL